MILVCHFISVEKPVTYMIVALKLYLVWADNMIWQYVFITRKKRIINNVNVALPALLTMSVNMPAGLYLLSCKRETC